MQLLSKHDLRAALISSGKFYQSDAALFIQDMVKQVPFLQKKMANLTNAIEWLENEIKKKEYNLSVLDNRTKELKYREDSMYPISSVHSTMALTYSKDGIYPNIEDKSIRPVSANMRLTRRNDFSSNLIDSLATEVVDAWAIGNRYHNYFQKMDY